MNTSTRVGSLRKRMRSKLLLQRLHLAFGGLSRGSADPSENVDAHFPSIFVGSYLPLPACGCCLPTSVHQDIIWESITWVAMQHADRNWRP